MKRNQFFILSVGFMLMVFLLMVSAQAKSGCCSWHGGVCSYPCSNGEGIGYECCDGTALSSKCAPYYPKCENPKPDPEPEPEPGIVFSSESIKIANWNLQVFGETKASKDELMNSYASIIDDYDIIFVQEIRNKDQTAFPKLCSLLPSYNCRVSSRAGRSSSKEQYGAIYRKGIEIENWEDYNPDSQDRWERPPIEVTFNIGEYDLAVYNIHIKPDDASQEMDYLDDIVKTSGNVIVLGDLNADCSYYNHLSENDFDGWNWIIGNSEDTTVSSTDCAYDRIILNADAYGEYVNDGVYTQGITKDMSDHYLVWVELKLDDVIVEFEEPREQTPPEEKEGLVKKEENVTNETINKTILPIESEPITEEEPANPITFFVEEDNKSSYEDMKNTSNVSGKVAEPIEKNKIGFLQRIINLFKRLRGFFIHD